MKKLTNTILIALSFSASMAFASPADEAAPSQAVTSPQMAQSQISAPVITDQATQVQISDTAQRNQVDTITALCTFAVTVQAMDSQSVLALLATTEPEPEPEPEPLPSPLSFPKPGPIRV